VAEHALTWLRADASRPSPPKLRARCAIAVFSPVSRGATPRKLERARLKIDALAPGVLTTIPGFRPAISPAD
jgi:hypothetical protein